MENKKIVLALFLTLLTLSIIQTTQSTQSPDPTSFSSNFLTNNPYALPPTIQNATVKPTDVRPGDLMTVTATITDPQGITQVTAKMPYENPNGTGLNYDLLNLTLTSGSKTNGTWTAQWQVHDTIEKNYTTTLTAYSSSGLSASTTVNWTDSPGTWTVGSGGDSWTGNVTHSSTTEVQSTGYVELRQKVDDYVSYWRFDEGSGTTTYDESTNNNDGAIVSENWWNSSYFYRKQLTVTNNNNTNLTAGDPINFTIDTASLISAGKMQPDCSDLRITYQTTEINRTNTTACNTSATMIWFNAQEVIPNETSTSDYYVYYDNPSAGTPDTGGITTTQGYNLTVSQGGESQIRAQYTTGKYGKALDFDGVDDYVEVPNSSSLDITDAITLGGWIKFNEFEGSEWFITHGGYTYYFGYEAGGTQFKFSFWNETGARSDAIIPTSELDTTHWWHIIGTFDKTSEKHRIYLNGALYNETTFNSSIRSKPSEGVDIGRKADIRTNYVNGTIDSVRIYNRTLTPTEINQTRDNEHYSAGNMTSVIRDAESFESDGYLWKNISFEGDLPSGTGVDIYFRSSWDNSTWTNWTKIQDNATSGTEYELPEQRRYGQWRLQLETTNLSRTPEIYNVSLLADPETGNPTLNFTSPTEPDNSYLGRNWTEVNITIDENERNLDNFLFNWNGTNYTYFDDSLVLGMNFDNNSRIGEGCNGASCTAKDFSKYGNDGAFEKKWTEGQVGGALAFDGVDDYIEVPDNDSLDIGTGGLTLSGWIKGEHSQATSWPRILSKAPRSAYRDTNGYQIDMASDGDCIAQIGNGTDALKLSTNVAVNDSEWHFVTLTWDGNTGKLFVDGVERDSGTWSGNISNSYDFVMGRAADAGYFFNGTIDQVRIYNRSLNATEINWTYQRGLNGQSTNVSEEGLVGEWSLNESSGDTAEDTSGQGNNGTLNNFLGDPVWTSKGKFGKALSFDGVDDWVDINDSSIFDMGGKNEITVTCWLKLNKLPSNHVDGYPFVFGNNHHYFLFFNKYQGDIRFSVDNSTGAGHLVKFNDTEISAGEWFMLTGTYDGSTQKIYLNGVEKDSTSWSGTIESGVDMRISREKYTLDGLIDGARIYNRSLSAQEIQHLYQSNLKKYNQTQYRFYENVTDQTEGTYTYYGWANDTAGNVNSTETRTINFDFTPPTTTASAVISDGSSYNFGEWTDSSYVNVTLSCSDSGGGGGAGCDVKQYCVDTTNSCTPDTTYTDPVQISTEGINYIRFRANDTVGNLEVTNSETVKIDRTAPSLNWTPPTPGNNTYRTENWTEINLTLDEPFSGLDTLNFNWWNGTDWINSTFYNDSLVLGLNFNEGNGTEAEDISKYGNNGTYRGSALSFDGVNDYVDCGNDSSLDVSNYTIVGWAKPYTSGVQGRHLVERGPITGQGYLIQLWDNDDIYFYQSVGGDFYVISQAAPFPHDNNFHQFAMTFTYNGTTSTLTSFLDGKQKESRSTTGTPDYPLSTDPLKIGHGDFNGTIDDLRIYNRSLSAEEIQQLYKGTYHNDTGLVLNIPFKENTESGGTTAEDISGMGNNGTLNNFADYSVGYGDSNPSGWTSYGRPLWSSGKFGQGMAFNGVDDYVEMGDVVRITYPITITAWVNLQDSSYTDEQGAVFRASSWRLETVSCGYDPKWGFRLDNYDTGYHPEFAGSRALEIGKWEHIAATYNGQKVRLYLNGVLDGEFNETMTPGLASESLLLAHGIGAKQHYFNGFIDDIRIYNRSLSPEEIKAHYRSELKKHNSTQWRFYDNLSTEPHLHKFNLYGEDKLGHSSQVQRTVYVNTISISEINFTDSQTEHEFNLSVTANHTEGDKFQNCYIHCAECNPGYNDFNGVLNTSYGGTGQAECSAEINTTKAPLDTALTLNVSFTDTYEQERYSETTTHKLPNKIPKVYGPVFTDCSSGHCFNIFANATDENGDSDFDSCTIHYQDDDGNGPTTLASTLNVSYGDNNTASCTGEISNSTTYLSDEVEQPVEIWVDFTDTSTDTNTTEHKNNTLPNHEPEINPLSTVNIGGEHAFNVSTTVSDVDNDTTDCTALLDDTTSGTTCTLAMTKSGNTCYLKVNTSTCSNFNVEDWIDIIGQVNDSWDRVNSSKVSQQIPNKAPGTPADLTLLINDSFNDSTHVVTHHPLINWSNPTDEEGDEINITAAVGTSLNPVTEDNTVTVPDDSMTLGYGVSLQDGETYYFRIKACDKWDCSDYLGNQTHNFTMNSNPAINWVKTEPVNLTGIDKVNLTANVTDEQNDPIEWTNFTVYYNNYSTVVNTTELSLNRTQGSHTLELYNVSSEGNANLTIYYEYLEEEKTNTTLLEINNTTTGTHEIEIGDILNPVELNVTLEGQDLVNLTINNDFIAQINSSQGTYYNDSITLEPNQINNFNYTTQGQVNITETKVKYYVNNTTQVEVNNNNLGLLEINQSNKTFTNVSQNWLTQSTNITYQGGLINITNSSLSYLQTTYLENNTNGTQSGNIWEIYNLSLKQNITYNYLIKSSDSFEISSTTGSYMRGSASPSVVSGPNFQDIPGKHAFTTHAIAEDLDGANTLNCTVNLTGGGKSLELQGAIENISGTEINCSLNVTNSTFSPGTLVDTHFIFTDDVGLTATSPTDSHEIPNRKPNITSISIEQEKPTTVTDLSSAYNYSEPENDAITSEIYEWYRNGNSTDQTSKTLAHQNTKKGENWSVCLQIIDEYNAISDKNCSQNVTIQNYPPSLGPIQITTYAGHELTGETIATDYDNETDYRNCTVIYSSNNNQSSKPGILDLEYGTNLEAKCYENVSAAEKTWLIPNQELNLTLEVCDGNLSGGSNCSTINKTTTIPNKVPTISLASPQNNTNTTTNTIQFTWSSGDKDGDHLIHEIRIYNSGLYDNATTTNTNYTTTLEDGVYYWNVSVTDLYNSTELNTTNSKTRKLIVDTTPPQLINGTCNITHYNGTNTTNTTITNITQTIQLTQGDNITCSLKYSDNSQNWSSYLQENGLKNASLFISYEVQGNRSRSLNFTNNQTQFNLTNIPAGQTIINLTSYDWLSNQNTTTIELSANDTESPAIQSFSHFPADLRSLDPGTNVTLSANLTDNLRIDQAFLYYRRNDTFNQTNWSSKELNLTAGKQRNGTFSTNLNFNSTNLTRGNYTYYIWVNDTYGNEINSSQQNQTGLLEVWYDHTINATIENVPSTAIIYQNFTFGTVQINNLGDYNYTCALPNVSTLSGNSKILEFNYNSTSIDLSPGETKTREINATGKEVGVTTIKIPIDCSCLNCTKEGSDYTTTLTLNPETEIIPSGPYFDSYVSYPDSMVYNSTGKSELKIKNIGNETAYNFSAQFKEVPNGITIDPSTITENSLTKEATNWQIWKYFYIKVAGTISSGTYCFNLTANCDNCNRTQNLKEICIPVEGKPTTKTVTETTPGGGRAAPTGAGPGLSVEEKKKLMQTKETLEIVRKEQQEFPFIVENIFDGPLEEVHVNVSGYLSQYLSLEPTYVDYIPVNDSYNFTVEITAPKYFTRGTYYLNFTINATINETTTKNNITRKKITHLKEHRRVVLIIHGISREEAERNLNKSIQVLQEFNQLGFYSKDVENLIEKAKSAIENKNYVETEGIVEKVQETREKAFKARQGIKEIEELIKKAEKREIKVEKTKRLLNLAKAAFKRGDYSTALSRTQEAELVYATETKGEFSLGYFIKTNWDKLTLLGITLIILGLFLLYELRLWRIKSKLKSLKKEEDTLIGLMKQTQKECFEQKKLSMNEYIEAMTQYENRLSKVISDIISWETKKVHLFKLRGREKALRDERQRLLDLMKETQKLYMERKRLETRKYRNRLRSYSQRFSEIEEKIATLEAEKKIKKQTMLRYKAWNALVSLFSRRKKKEQKRAEIKKREKEEEKLKKEERREKKKKKQKPKKSLTQRYKEWKQRRKEKQRREKLKKQAEKREKQRRKEEKRRQKEMEKQRKERKKQEEKRQKERERKEAEKKAKEKKKKSLTQRFKEWNRKRKENKERKRIEKKLREEQKEREKRRQEGREEKKKEEQRRKEKKPSLRERFKKWASRKRIERKEKQRKKALEKRKKQEKKIKEEFEKEKSKKQKGSLFGEYFKKL